MGRLSRIKNAPRTSARYAWRGVKWGAGWCRDSLCFFLSMFNIRRLFIVFIMALLCAPFAYKMHESGRNSEFIINVLTIGVLGAMFLLLTVATYVITTRWTQVARALTAISAILSILFWGAIISVINQNWWPNQIRWITRTALIWTIICVVDGVISYFQYLNEQAKDAQRDTDRSQNMGQNTR